MAEHDSTHEARLEEIRQRARAVEGSSERRAGGAERRRAESPERPAEAERRTKTERRSREAALSDETRSAELASREPVTRASGRGSPVRAAWRPIGASSHPSGPRDIGKYQFGGGFMGYPWSPSIPYFAAPPGGYGGPYADDPYAPRPREHEGHLYGNWGEHERPGPHDPTWTPRTEMFDREGKLVIRVELPGMDKDDVDVSVEGDRLVIEGERRQDEERAREGYYRSEWSYGYFHREIPLPEPVQHDDVKAKFKNGVLEVAIPHSEEPGRRKHVRIET